MPTINLYYAPERSLQKVVDDCNAQAKGRYRVAYQVLQRGADDQRVQMVRRLAAGDSGLDVLGLDVTWTREFASADWVREWTGGNRAQAQAGTLAGPLESASYQAKLYAAPRPNCCGTALRPRSEPAPVLLKIAALDARQTQFDREVGAVRQLIESLQDIPSPIMGRFDGRVHSDR